MNEDSFISMALAYVIGVGRRVWSWATMGANRVEGGEGPTYAWSKGWGPIRGSSRWCVVG
jgi:hypothetical protein